MLGWQLPKGVTGTGPGQVCCARLLVGTSNKMVTGTWINQDVRERIVALLSRRRSRRRAGYEAATMPMKARVHRTGGHAHLPSRSAFKDGTRNRGAPCGPRQFVLFEFANERFRAGYARTISRWEASGSSSDRRAGR
jgi:hypothetical protein